ncbi:hypothetical protein AB4Z52_36085 [Rhizobium sp. 2YAF20]|jgi:hypothetical protein|uniref:hypothetical protein n=1 Tax=Rhizobium sp. 2YAF20 TaxID=3233027 RepID=UPI003F9A05C8
MQLKLDFHEQAEVDDTPIAGPWEKIDPLAQTAALEILARLIARVLTAKRLRETIDE